MKRVTTGAILGTASLLCGLAVSAPANAATPAGPRVSDSQVAAFEAQLQNSGQSDAWRSLTPSEQEAVVAVATDVDFTELVASGKTDAAELTAVSDLIEVETEEKTTRTPIVGKGAPRVQEGLTAAAARKYDVHSWWTNSYKVGGITITKIRQDYYYVTGSNRVLSSKSCQHSSTNYAPTRSLSGQTSHWKTSAGKGRCSTAWKLSYAVGWIPTPFYRSFTQNMQVKGSGTERKWFVTT